MRVWLKLLLFCMLPYSICKLPISPSSTIKITGLQKSIAHNRFFCKFSENHILLPKYRSLAKIENRKEIYGLIGTLFKEAKQNGLEHKCCDELQFILEHPKIDINAYFKNSYFNAHSMNEEITTLLHEGVKYDLPGVVDFLLKRKALVSMPDELFKYPLHYVQSQNVAELLLAQGPQWINESYNENGLTPLFTIPISLIPYFVKRGANLNAKLKTSFLVADSDKIGFSETWKLRYKDPKNISETLVYKQKNKTEVVERIILTYPALTPLMKAIVNGDFERFKVLLTLTTDEDLKIHMNSLKTIATAQFFYKNYSNKAPFFEILAMLNRIH